jgi:hypothetical protein
MLHIDNLLSDKISVQEINQMLLNNLESYLFKQ